LLKPKIKPKIQIKRAHIHETQAKRAYIHETHDRCCFGIVVISYRNSALMSPSKYLFCQILATFLKNQLASRVRSAALPYHSWKHGEKLQILK